MLLLVVLGVEVVQRRPQRQHLVLGVTASRCRAQCARTTHCLQPLRLLPRSGQHRQLLLWWLPLLAALVVVAGRCRGVPRRGWQL